MWIPNKEEMDNWTSIHHPVKAADPTKVGDTIRGARQARADSINNQYQANNTQHGKNLIGDAITGGRQLVGNVITGQNKAIADSIQNKRVKNAPSKPKQQTELSNNIARTLGVSNAQSQQGQATSLTQATQVSKQLSGNGVPDKIPLFMQGDRERTPMHTDTMNQIVRTLNRNNNIIGGKWIGITKSDSNVVISYTGPTGSAAGGGETPTTSISFRGEFNPSTTYQTNDIVTLTSEAGYYDIQGTYVCLQDNTVGQYPPTGLTRTNTYWDTLSKGHWKEMAIGQFDLWSQTKYPQGNYTYIDKNEIQMIYSGSSEDEYRAASINPNGGLAFSFGNNTLNFSTETAYDTYGLTISPIKLAVCVNGTTKYLWVLGMLSES